MFETRLPRIKHIALAGDVAGVRSDFVNEIQRFPIRVTTD
jgi:hypothetical protein